MGGAGNVAVNQLPRRRKTPVTNWSWEHTDCSVGQKYRRKQAELKPGQKRT